MSSSRSIQWTNNSVTQFAKGADPIVAIQRRAREIVLRARELGWEGPPFNPLEIAKSLGATIEANSSIADARLLSSDDGPRIEYNPRQPRERVRFSIAHEVAHLLFEDWHEHIRNRGGENGIQDEWQLEMLCNLAASEFVMPIGSLVSTNRVPPIEDLMVARRKHDVSAEAFLIRTAKTSTSPVCVFFASPHHTEDGSRRYKIDYAIPSPTAPTVRLAGMRIPTDSIVQSCTAIGFTNRAVEEWVSSEPILIECVGLPAYPGNIYPRVAGIVRFELPSANRKPIQILHGNALEPQGSDRKIVCQLVNDRAAKWGGGIARKAGRKYPEAERNFSDTLLTIPNSRRLGEVIFSRATDEVTIASLIAQEGFGPSPLPRIRYAALAKGLEVVAKKAIATNASIHMPRLGTGAAGGEWTVIEEIIDDVMVRNGLSVTVYDLPPKREQLELF